MGASCPQPTARVLMIEKKEIIQIAKKLYLDPAIIEKDYALGWLLMGIYAHLELKNAWIFKGGTCLKKCYFHQYRFSEDLDFTLQDSSHEDIDRLKNG